ncbi:hypothetical protein [Chitinimonas sp. BJYL2]|uniref:hypothetical protein n=1 Tax=Chitinimonas sp. BJYL2 TaxID=2976696 RepID=UPI0022B55765|nr:hypothetical protein [Chitinimonas sp. BJYL2]
MSSTEWAAWIQAIGSVAAIIAAAWIAIHQSKIQHRNALEVHKTEQLTAQISIAKTLYVLSANSSKAMKHIASQLHDREAISHAAEGHIHCDIGELIRIDTYLGSIPLHSIPYSLVTPTMVLEATVRQFKDKIEMALRLHRNMDASMFDDFFKTVTTMSSSLEATCQDFEAEVKRLEG